MANTLAQNPAAATYSGVTSVAVTFGGACTSGSLIVAVHTHDTESASVLTGVSDPTNGAYTVDAGPLLSYHAYLGGAIEICSKGNTATTALTVTGTTSTAQGGILKVYELTGQAAVPFDSNATQDLNDGSVSLAITTLSGNCTIFAGGVYGNNGAPDNPAGADTSFTVGYGPTVVGSSFHFVEHRVDAGAQGLSTLTFNGSGTRKIGAYAAVAYKTSTGGGGGGTLIMGRSIWMTA